MKVFRVVTEQDGRTIKEPGIVQTEVQRSEYRYGADDMEQVWNEIKWLRDNPEITVIAILEEHPAITPLARKGG